MIEEPRPDPVFLIARLLRGEMDLAVAEVRHNARAMIGGIVMLVVALLLGMVAVNLLAGALVLAAVSAGVPAAWSPVVVAGALLVVALVLVRWALSVLRPSRLVPVKAAARLRRDAETLMERMRHDSQT